MIREFIIPCSVDVLYNIMISDVPKHLEGTEGYCYKIEEEIDESERLYRKASMRKDLFLEMIPSIVRDHAPECLLDTTKRVFDEGILYKEEKKLRWTIRLEGLDKYWMCGTTCLIPLSDSICKVSILIRFELDPGVNRMFRPLIEKWIPDVIVSNMKEMYTTILGSKNMS